MGIRIGCCTGFTKDENGKMQISDIDILKDAGFAYIELAVAATAALSDEEFAGALEAVRKSPIPCEAANVMFPGDFQLTGKDIDYDKIDAYCKMAFDRMAQLGAKVIVFGSGAARKIPAGFSPAKAFDQLAYLLRRISVYARAYGIDIVIEPLNKGETNVINSVIEGAQLFVEADSPNVFVLADYYHMAVEKEDMKEIIKEFDGADVLRHAHIANPEGRVFPTENEDYSEFADMLKTLKYNGRLSVEGKATDIAVDAPLAFKALTKAFAGV